MTKSGILQFAAAWTDLEMIILSEVSQTDKGKHHKISLIRETQKNDADELIYGTETDSQS